MRPFAGLFHPGERDRDQRELYGSYLRSRVRPTVAALMEENRVTELERFEKEVPFPQPLVDEFLTEAMEMDRPEITVWAAAMQKGTLRLPGPGFFLVGGTMESLNEQILTACRTELCGLYPGLNGAFALLPQKDGRILGTDGGRFSSRRT